jgi:2'-5' RNA ligase
MRLFIAIALPNEAKVVLGTVADELARQADEGRLVRRENLHLTLAFIGETERVQDALEATRRAQWLGLPEPFALTIMGVGSFAKHRGAHSWWAGIEPSKPLETLAAAVKSELAEAGFTLEKRSFKPHITLARGVRTSHPLVLAYDPLTVWATHLTLYKSDLSGPTPRYAELYRAAPYFVRSSFVETLPACNDENER